MSDANPFLARPGPDDRRTLDAVTLDEMAPIARGRMHRAAWDYVDGGASDEITLAGNLASWRAVRPARWAPRRFRR